jgi:hypothetical protein
MMVQSFLHIPNETVRNITMDIFYYSSNPSGQIQHISYNDITKIDYITDTTATITLTNKDIIHIHQLNDDPNQWCIHHDTLPAIKSFDNHYYFFLKGINTSIQNFNLDPENLLIYTLKYTKASFNDYIFYTI